MNAEIEDDDGEPIPPSCLDKAGLRVQAERCSTCIFRPGNLMDLDAGRLRDMVEDVKRHDTYVICHQTLDQPLGAVCKGSYETLFTTPIQLAERLGFVVWVREGDN